MEWLYGRNVVRQALQRGARRRAHLLAATPPALEWLGAPPPGLPVERHAARELDELCGSREHQGLALQVDAYPYAGAADVLRGRVVVVLDEVSDPHNLGAVARSALAAGAAGLVVPRHRAAAVTPAAVKASAGALELLPVAQVTNTVAFLKEAKDAGFWVYGAPGRGPHLVPAARPHRPPGAGVRRRGPGPAAAGGAHLRRPGGGAYRGAGREPQRERGGGAVPLRGRRQARRRRRQRHGGGRRTAAGPHAGAAPRGKPATRRPGKA